MKKNYLFAVLFCFIGAVAFSQTIVTNNDAFTVNGGTGAYIPGARHNDIINEVPGTQAACNTALYTLISSPIPQITLANDCGGINVAAGTPPGIYTCTYQACLTSAPNVCDTAEVVITVCNIGNPVISALPAPCDGNSTTMPISVSGLPASGTWTLHYYANNLGWQELQGTGTTASLNLQPGGYIFYVQNAEGCQSANIDYYVSYPETLTGMLSVDFVDVNNNGEANVGDILLYNVSVTNLLACDITNLHPVGGNLIQAGNIPVLAGGATNNTNITASHTVTQADINNGGYMGMIFLAGTYGNNQEAYTKLFSEFQFALNDGIRMIAFVDTNGDGVKNNGEQNYENGEFTFQMGNSQPTTAYTSNGEYVIYETNPQNTYSLYYTVNNSTCASQYIVQVPSYSNITVAPGNGITDYYFPLTVSPCTDLQVHMYTNGAVPGMPFHNYIVVQNQGNQAIASATVTYTAPAGIAVSSISESGAVASANGFTYGFSSLAPGDFLTIDVTLAVPAIPAVALGDELASTVSVTVPSGDTNEDNNTFTLIRTITGSFDPNDKAEVHGGEIPYPSFTSDDYLTYTIRFENTGNGNANFVKVTDDLDNKLNPATLKLVATSHDYILERTGNHLEWKLNNIQLPPHQPNTTIGQGYIIFRVKPMPGYAVGDIISNSANIFFDTNPAITTNTVTTEFVSTAGVAENVAKNITIYPNPANNVLYFLSDTDAIATVAIIDVAGKTVLRQTVAQSSIDISSLAKGMYFVKLQLATGGEKIVKVIKE